MLLLIQAISDKEVFIKYIFTFYRYDGSDINIFTKELNNRYFVIKRVE